MAVSTGAAILGGSLISGVLGSRSASKAAGAAGAASAASIAEQRRQFDITQEQARPYREAGTRALRSLEDMMYGKFDMSSDPSYQFRLSEGEKALERSQAGRRLGGRAAKEALRYGQGFASTEYGKQFGRLATVAGFGPPTIGAGMPTGIPGTLERAGAIQAQTTMAGGQAINEAIQGGLGNYMTWQAYNQNKPVFEGT